MRDLLDAPSSDDELLDEYESPAHDKFSSHQGFLFGYASLKVDLKSLHPSPSQIFILWEVFKENVDPVVRILHRPTAKNILMNAASSVDRVSRAGEALLFSIYFGAVVSLTDEQCMQLLDEKKADLIKKYRFATEQALARADFLNSSSLMCLQAFVFFLVFVRHMDDSRLVWALGGLAIHIAQALGIHRDGTHFGLPPFDIEMRRRLWWHIAILDNRSSEDHGTDPTFTEQFYDTRLPLNLNDEDIYPEMKESPKERIGATEMMFCLIRFELNIFSRRLNFTAPGSDRSRARDQTLEEQETMIDACHRKIEEKYLRHCDMSMPIYWVSATVARLILAKMWLMVHHPRSFVRDSEGQPLPQDTKDRLFITSIEVIEFSYLLEQNENTAKWGWLFRTYTQWQSVAFVLSEICIRPPGPEIDRAWRAVESVYTAKFVGQATNHKGMLWKPMRHLMTKAKAVRLSQGKDTEAIPNVPHTTASLDSARLPTGRSNNTLTDFNDPPAAQANADTMNLDLSGGWQPQGSAAGQQQYQRGMSMQSAMSGGDSQMQGLSESPVMSDGSNDFLNWGGWAPGVGDFTVAPDPVVQYFDNVQQEWF